MLYKLYKLKANSNVRVLSTVQYRPPLFEANSRLMFTKLKLVDSLC